MKTIIKKIWTVPLALFLIFSLAACGGSRDPAGEEGNEGDGGQDTEEPMLPDLAFTKEAFEGKSVVVYGDSITYGAQTSGPDYVWIKKLGDKLGFTYTNLAVNGAMLTYRNAIRDSRGSGAQYIREFDFINKEADYAFLFFGANDFTHGVKVGENDETCEKIGDVATFKQGIRWAVNTLREQNPDIVILFITPLYRNDVTKSAYGFGIEEFGKAIAEMSAVLGYYYVDTTGFFTPENCGPDSELTPDQLHPNDLGQQKLYEFIAASAIKHS